MQMKTDFDARGLSYSTQLYSLDMLNRTIQVKLCEYSVWSIFLLFCIMFKKDISSSSELLSNYSLFGGQL